MPEMLQIVRKEVADLTSRLKFVREKLMALELQVGGFRIERQHVEEQLQAATRYLAVLEAQEVEIQRSAAAAASLATRSAEAETPTEPEASSAAIVEAAGLTLTQAEIDEVELPSAINGRVVRPDSKRARVIQACIAILKKREVVNRNQITEILKQLEILGAEKNPETALSVILSEAKDIFSSNRSGWFLVNRSNW